MVRWVRCRPGMPVQWPGLAGQTAPDHRHGLAWFPAWPAAYLWATRRDPPWKEWPRRQEFFGACPAGGTPWRVRPAACGFDLLLLGLLLFQLGFERGYPFVNACHVVSSSGGDGCILSGGFRVTSCGRTGRIPGSDTQSKAKGAYMQTSFACAPSGGYQQPEPRPWRSTTSALRQSAVRLVAVRPPPLPIALGARLPTSAPARFTTTPARVALNLPPSSCRTTPPSGHATAPNSGTPPSRPRSAKTPPSPASLK